ncbi:MAG: diacylglycerol kinase family protein [Acutalibacteraceae bacterium]
MKKLSALFKRFFYAARGIVSTVKTERNMRIHLVCVIYMLSILILTDWFKLEKSDWCALLLASALVLSGEIVNTAIENAVNLETKEYNELAKKAKDAGSGAVLVNAVFAVIVGLVVLLQPQAFQQMYHYFAEKPLMFVLFVLSIVPATAFIFLGLPYGKKKK